MLISASYQTGFVTRSFLCVGFREGRGWARAVTSALLVYAGHRLTRYNVNQVTLLNLDSLDVTWLRHVCLLVAWTRPECLVLSCAVNDVISEERYLLLARFSRSRSDSKSNGSRLRLHHLQMGDDVIDQNCIALDSRVYFKLWTGTRVGITLYIEWFQM